MLRSCCEARVYIYSIPDISNTGPAPAHVPIQLNNSASFTSTTGSLQVEVYELRLESAGNGFLSRV